MFRGFLFDNERRVCGAAFEIDDFSDPNRRHFNLRLIWLKAVISVEKNLLRIHEKLQVDPHKKNQRKFL